MTGKRLSLSELQGKARCLRCHIIGMTATAGSGHPGGSLSSADIVAALYFGVLRHDPDRPQWEDRDRFVLSKGHAAPVLYAALAESGYFPRELLYDLRKCDSPLQGHPDMGLLPGVEASTGSLGQGLSIANGMALAGRLDGKDYRVYVLLGDGEVDEGQVWEAAMAASHYKLDSVTAILDRNRQQIDGWTRDVMSLEPLADKWRAFGWHVLEADGHDMEAILEALTAAQQVKGRPSIVIAHTTKGKGASFMENNLRFHGNAPDRAEMDRGLGEVRTEERCKVCDVQYPGPC
ncbi:MAG TPA: transketolase [Anaerolineae bacterium]|nr:transketolase [Anaerolineae bacterium]